MKWETPASTGKPLRPQDRAPLTANEMFREKKRSEANARDTGARAICKIKLALRQPDAQQDGKAATLEDWDEEFKPTLGSYKKFLLSRPDQFRIIEGSELGMFTLEIVSNETVAAPNWEDIAWAKGWNKGKGKGKGKMSKDGSVPAPFPSAKGKGKDADKGKGKGKEAWKGKGKGKEKGAEKPKAVPVTTLGLRVLTERAVSEIKQALLSPGCQADGRPYMPKDWSARYAPTLGPYMDFLLTQPDHFCLAESRPGNYTIEVVSAERTAKPERAARAVRQLAKAAQDELAAGQGPAADDDDMEEVEAEGEAEQEAEAGDDLGDGEDGEAAEEDGEVPDDGYGEAEDAGDDFAVDPEEGAADSDDDPAFPVEKAAKHGSYIRSLLSAGLLSGGTPAKKARTD